MIHGDKQGRSLAAGILWWKGTIEKGKESVVVL
jgi:hypothetical protein